MDNQWLVLDCSSHFLGYDACFNYSKFNGSLAGHLVWLSPILNGVVGTCIVEWKVGEVHLRWVSLSSHLDWCSIRVVAFPVMTLVVTIRSGMGRWLDT